MNETRTSRTFRFPLASYDGHSNLITNGTCSTEASVIVEVALVIKISTINIRPTSKLSTQIQLKVLFVTSFPFRQFGPQKVGLVLHTRKIQDLSIPLFRIFN